MQSIRGVIIVLLTRLGLPLDICRIIYELRYASYEALQWHVMGLHYRVGATHWYIAARPWRFAGRTRRIYHSAPLGLITSISAVRFRQLLQLYVDSAIARYEIKDDTTNDPAYYAELGRPFAEALIYEYVGNTIYFDDFPFLRTQAELDSFRTLTPHMAQEIQGDLEYHMWRLISAWRLCGVPITATPIVRDEDYELHDGWTLDMLVERVHAIWMATRPADR